MRDVFISHSTKDKATADKIVASLEQNEVTCWIAPRNISAGVNYGAAITRAIRDCKVLLLIYSENSNASEAVFREVQKGFEERRTLIPVRIDNIPASDDLSFYLSGIQWVDATREQEDYAELAQYIASLPKNPLPEHHQKEKTSEEPTIVMAKSEGETEETTEEAPTAVTKEENKKDKPAATEKPKRKRRILPRLVACLLVAAVGVGVFVLHQHVDLIAAVQNRDFSEVAAFFNGNGNGNPEPSSTYY
ncbi:MAG: toll/interleukin-1 receptor domain-containing protein [Defluviitaleaceae bacterium]|nr:toll/interleukin-1 receptor domain-containing protein [Defluviitaleaceae bacterium]